MAQPLVEMAKCPSVDRFQLIRRLRWHNSLAHPLGKEKKQGECSLGLNLTLELSLAKLMTTRGGSSFGN